jgi:hypothetical protein
LSKTDKWFQIFDAKLQHAQIAMMQSEGLLVICSFSDAISQQLLEVQSLWKPNLEKGVELVNPAACNLQVARRFDRDWVTKQFQNRSLLKMVSTQTPLAPHIATNPAHHTTHVTPYTASPKT